MNEGAGVSAVFSAVRRLLVDSSVPHAFIGALAAVAWGRPRATTDVDLVIVVDENTFANLDNRLRESGMKRGVDVGPSDPREALPDIAVYWSTQEPSVRLDVFVAKTPFEHEVVENAREAKILGEATNLASPEACIVYKLLADRPRDRDDIQAILRARRAAGDPIDWKRVDAWAEQWEIEDLATALRAQDS